MWLRLHHNSQVRICVAVSIHLVKLTDKKKVCCPPDFPLRFESTKVCCPTVFGNILAEILCFFFLLSLVWLEFKRRPLPNLPQDLPSIGSSTLSGTPSPHTTTPFCLPPVKISMRIPGQFNDSTGPHYLSSRMNRSDSQRGAALLFFL